MSSNIGVNNDDTLIGFEVRDGARRIKCEVSNQALEAASGLADGSPTALRRRSFDRFRTLINAAAALRISALPLGSAGPILLTTRDLRRVPGEHGAPVFGVAARVTSARTVSSEPVGER